MNYSRQSGLALVQVLLISALLLLLVVQLSKNASNSARIATQLKEKAAAGVKSQTNFANAQYLLITQQKDFQLNWMGRNSINFSSDARQVEPSVYVELQDLAGLLSTSFFGQEWLSFVKSDQQKLETVKFWQGYGDDRFGSSNNRNARIPYIEEIRLLGDWRTDELQYLTYFPTGFFNVATAPESLLRLVYPGDIVNQIVELRRTNKLDRGSMMLIRGIDGSSVFPPSDYSQVTVKVHRKNFDDTPYVRTRMYHVQTGKSVPILEVGIGTL